MKVLFIHQNFPGQFKNLAAHFGAQQEHEAFFITKRKAAEIPGVRKILYETKRKSGRTTHHFVKDFENGVIHGEEVADRCVRMRKRGLIPDIVVAHPGWGESLFIKDVFPDTLGLLALAAQFQSKINRKGKRRRKGTQWKSPLQRAAYTDGQLPHLKSRQLTVQPGQHLVGVLIGTDHDDDRVALH